MASEAMFYFAAMMRENARTQFKDAVTELVLGHGFDPMDFADMLEEALSEAAQKAGADDPYIKVGNIDFRGDCDENGEPVKGASFPFEVQS